MTAESDSDDSRMNIQLTIPSGVVYSYFLEPDEQTVIPFSEGSGDYLITCYQQVDGNQYAALYTETLTIKLQNEFLPFLYPNQYVDFSAKSEACNLAAVSCQRWYERYGNPENFLYICYQNIFPTIMIKLILSRPDIFLM